MEQKPFEIRTYARSELAAAYGVCVTTFSKEISRIPDLKVKKGAKIIYPSQVQKIIEHLGTP